MPFCTKKEEESLSQNFYYEILQAKMFQKLSYNTYFKVTFVSKDSAYYLLSASGNAELGMLTPHSQRKQIEKNKACFPNTLATADKVKGIFNTLGSTMRPRLLTPLGLSCFAKRNVKSLLLSPCIP